MQPAPDVDRQMGSVPSDAERVRAVYAEYARTNADRTRWSTACLGNRLILEERQRRMQMLLRGAGLGFDNIRVLDVGCGTGRVLASLVDLSVGWENLHGVDVIGE